MISAVFITSAAFPVFIRTKPNSPLKRDGCCILFITGLFMTAEKPADGSVHTRRVLKQVIRDISLASGLFPGFFIRVRMQGVRVRRSGRSLPYMYRRAVRQPVMV